MHVTQRAVGRDSIDESRNSSPTKTCIIIIRLGRGGLVSSWSDRPNFGLGPQYHIIAECRPRRWMDGCAGVRVVTAPGAREHTGSAGGREIRAI